MNDLLLKLGLSNLGSDNYHVLNWFQGLWVKMSVSQRDRLGLFQKIAKYVGDGIDLQTTIEEMSVEYLRLNRLSARGLLLAEWNGAMVKAGDDFSDAVADWVTTNDVMMIRSGEEGGSLVDSLNNLIKANEDRSNLISKLWGSLAYPVALFAMACGMMWMASTKILPAFETMVDPSTWPKDAQEFYATTYFFTDNWLELVISLVVLIAVIKVSLTNLTGPVRTVLDYIDPFSSYRRINSSLFLISLSSMMKTGTDVHRSLELLSNESSPYVQDKIDYMLDVMVDQGEDLGEAMDERFFDREVMMDVRFYTRGSISTDSIATIGQGAIDATINSIQSKANILRTLMMVLVGGYVLWMVGSIQGVTNALQSAAMS